MVRIERIQILSGATVSGTDEPVEGHYLGDPFVAARCPQCQTVNPWTRVQGTGPEAVRCRQCQVPVTPFRLTCGYTMVFDVDQGVAVTLGPEGAREVADRAREMAALSPESRQVPINLWAPSHLPGIIARVRPMIGNIGTCPGKPFPSSHNSGDFGPFLVQAPHEYALDQEDLKECTDGHMDADEVREGAILLAPVKVPGGGVYLGDVHAMQGDGEIAGHTTDVSAEVTLKVAVIPGLSLEGPMLLPRLEDLPPLARPYEEHLVDAARQLAAAYGTEVCDEVYPLQVVGSGPDLTAAVENGLGRMARLSGLSPEEVRNRATITGSIMISRLPGVVQVTALVPRECVERLGLEEVFRVQY